MSNFKYEESYLLASDTASKELLLAGLIAGSPDYYYYTMLHILNVDPSLADPNNSARFKKLATDWTKEPSYDYSLFQRLQNRATLLGYSPKTSDNIFETLRNQLGLSYHYTATSSSYDPSDDQPDSTPSTLAPASIDRDTLIKRSLADYPNSLPRVEAAALPYVANSHTLTPAQTKAVVQALSYPTLDKTVDAIVASNASLSSLRVIEQLTPAQLDALAKARPELVDARFVSLQLSKLLPSRDDSDWQADHETALAFYRAAYARVEPLPASLNTFKLTVLYHLIKTLVSVNTYDAQLFAAYAALPRDTYYYATSDTPRQVARFNESASAIPAVSQSDDEALIRTFLRRTLQSESAPPKALAAAFRPSFLNPLFAEVKLLANATGDAEKWYQMIDSHSAVAALKERVDLEFVPHNPVYFHPDDAIELRCAVKNVQHLVVKLFEINTYNYYKEELKQIDSNINLDGLVASEEFTFNYTEPSIQSVERTFAFPSLKGKRGVFVLEFIGNGKSSRALIRKGELNYITGISTSGQVIKVIDEDSVKVTKSSCLVDGNTYTSDDKGDITLPFSANSSNKNIILMTEGFASLQNFQHQSEKYMLVGGIFMDNSTFIQGERAPIVVRARLYLGNTQIPLTFLEDQLLTITTTDQSEQSIVTSKEVKPFALQDLQESTYLFKVPENVGSVDVKYEARIKILGRGGSSYETLTFNSGIVINSVNQTSNISDCYLRNTTEGYKLYLLGKGGEPIANKSLSMEFKSWILQDRINVLLQTDKHGIIHLGPLKDIVNIFVYADTQYEFNINRSTYTYPLNIHARTAEVVSIPYFGDETKITRSMFNLFEVNSNVTKDLFDSIQFDKERTNVQFKLPPGHFVFTMANPSMSINIDVCDGDVREGFIVGPSRILSYHPALVHGLNLTASADKTNLTIHVQNQTPSTRVHVLASYFVPNSSMYQVLGVGNTPVLSQEMSKAKSHYFSGRDLGDEITYIFNRKLAKNPMPGNSLKKPSMILAPWAVAETTQATESLKKGDSYGMKEKSARYANASSPITRNLSRQSQYSSYLEFLASPTSALLNLAPAADGTLVVPLSQLASIAAGAAFITVTAVNFDSTISRHVTLPQSSAAPLKDTKLIRALDPASHYTERKLITPVIPGKDFAIQNADSAKFCVYDTLPKAMALAKSVQPSANLQEFSFVTEWPTLTADVKREKFSRFYCHELALFIQRKDREFFDTVVRPFVAAKMHKTFIDLYLVGNTLALEKYAKSSSLFAKLNTLEKVLLAELFPQYAAQISRSIADAVAFEPLRPTRYDTLFKFALNLDVDKPEALHDDEGPNDESGSEHKMDCEVVEMASDCIAQAPASRSRMMKKNSAPMSFGSAPGGGGPTMAFAMASAPCPAPMMANFSMAPPPPPAGGYGMETMNLESRSRAAPAIYQQIEKTEELAETNYYKLLDSYPELVPCNEFWRDYAAHVAAGSKTPFLSKYIALIATSFTATIAGLAVLDLPFSTKDKEAVNRNGVVTFTPTTPLIVFHQELVASQLEADANVLVSQNFFDPANRYSYDAGEQTDIYVADEFLAGRVYGALVVVANLSSKNKKLDVLLQIPKGSVCVGPHPFYTRGVSAELSPYSTQRFEYSFYFPAPGKYQHFTAHVTEKDRVIAAVPPAPLVVVSKPTIVNKLSWQYIANHGTPAQVLEHLERENLHRTPLEHLYPRLSDADFWRKVISILSTRRFFDYTVWSFALLHKDTLYCPDFLSCDSVYLDVGESLSSALLNVDPIARGSFHYLEYAPLVNSRTHQIGNERKILNDKLNEQYKSFCRMLSYTANPSDIDLMSLVYYLLAQDRFEEAISAMERIGRQSNNQPASSSSSSSTTTIPTTPAEATAVLDDKKRKKAEKEKEKEEKRRLKEEAKKQKEELKAKKEEEKRQKKLAKKGESPATSSPSVVPTVPSTTTAATTTTTTTTAATTTTSVEPEQMEPMNIDEEGDEEDCIEISSFSPPTCLPEMQVQYDYLISYLDFFNSNPTHARKLAESYKNYPVSRWRSLFVDLHNKIQQITNDATTDVEDSENDRERRHAKMLSSEPSFDVSIEPNRSIAISYNNLTDITVNYYIMDIELLFSNNPFVHQESSGQFSFVSPNKKESFPLVQKNGTLTISIPAEFANSNILVDFASAGIHHNLTIYSNSLSVQITEKAGQLRVIHKQTKKPIAKAYVKVYQKSKSGSVEFWKDMYTDIAGYVDYSSVSSGNISDVSKFSILVLHDQFGAVIKEAKPPGM
eukprot:gene9805-11454_t